DICQAVLPPPFDPAWTRSRSSTPRRSHQNRREPNPRHCIGMLAVGMQSVRGALVGEPRIMTYPQRCPTHVKELRNGWKLALFSFHSQFDAELTTAISRRGVAGAMLVERARKISPAAGRLFAQRQRIRLSDGMTLKHSSVNMGSERITALRSGGR